jgi:NAD(P)H-dependent flavin oxidoreductase YrpB (nitropropane dioxygenase family)
MRRGAGCGNKQCPWGRRSRPRGSASIGVWVGTRMVASTEAFAHPEYKRRLLEAHGRATAVTTAFGPEYPNVPYRVLRTDLVQKVAGHEDQIPSSQPGDPPLGETALFPFTLRVPYTMPPFSAVVPTPDTTGRFDLMGFPAGEDSVRKIKDVRPAAEIIAEMMAEAREILREELTAMPESSDHRPASRT